MNINLKQAVALLLVILGVLMASTAQLTDLFGPGPTKAIVSIAGLLNSILAGTLGVITSQSSTVRDVRAMPGVETIVVNSKANSTLAKLAVDPAQNKIEALPGTESKLAQIAKG